ncbi:MAG: lactate utilization protein [Chloroflexi bacterium]|nr:lactate utilization protein [Chloroflexota bacterium]
MTAATTELMEQFKAEASRAGVVVHEARDAEETRNCVLMLAQERNVRCVVKSKSKVAGEIGLREHLEKAGIGVKETDLEEWIAQLAGQTTVRQRTIEQVAELISQGIGEKLKSDPKVLLSAAHRALRQSCIDADMGISEADFAIAETGTLVIVGNEGNTRLVAVLPRMHVTMVDCENLVPTLDDAAARLKSLAKKAPGQRMLSYVTYITGRNTTADIPGAIFVRAQGPEEEHIVLVHKDVGK